MPQKICTAREALPQLLTVQEQGVAPTQLDHLFLATATLKTIANLRLCPCRMTKELFFTLYFHFVP